VHTATFFAGKYRRYSRLKTIIFKGLIMGAPGYDTEWKRYILETFVEPISLKVFIVGEPGSSRDALAGLLTLLLYPHPIEVKENLDAIRSHRGMTILECRQGIDAMTASIAAVKRANENNSCVVMTGYKHWRAAALGAGADAFFTDRTKVGEMAFILKDLLEGYLAADPILVHSLY
jgi:hypothetical protein